MKLNVLEAKKVITERDLMIFYDLQSSNNLIF